MRRPPALAAALSVAVATLLATLTSATTAASAAPAAPAAPAPSISWGACTSGSLVRAGAQCGTVTVPLDYAAPQGRQVQLAVSRVKHTTAVSQGVMLVNPGGPGGSGLGLSTLGQYVPDGAGDSYDWIGFDPRGVGSSTPRLSCDTSYFDGPRPAYEPEVPGAEQAWLDRTSAYSQACGEADLGLLQHMHTTEVVRDMDEIRKALGAPQINYYGFSYGTYLGQVYTTLFPGKVRRMVLDGVVNPLKVWAQANLDQDVAFQKTVELWFAWVAQYDSTYHLGTTAEQVSKTWYAEKDALQASPAGGTIGSSEWNDVFLYAGYYDTLWTYLADVFSAYVNDGDTAAVVDAYDALLGPGDDNGYAVYLAVQCTDAAWPSTYQAFRASNVRTARTAPFETWGNAWYNAPCLSWPVEAAKPVTVTGTGVGGFLLVNQTLDAATPYSGALEVRRLFKDAVLVAEPGGTTHAGTLYGNPCTDGIIAAYLADGTLPARRPGNGADVLCTPLPHPVPDGAEEVVSPADTSAQTTGTSAYKIRTERRRALTAGF